MGSYLLVIFKVIWWVYLEVKLKLHIERSEYLNLLHCWQKRCRSPSISTSGAFAWNSQTLWRRWYVLAFTISAVHSSTWQEGCLDPSAVDTFRPERVKTLFLLVSSTTSSSSSSSSSSMFLFPSHLLFSISLKGGKRNKLRKTRVRSTRIYE